MNHFGIVKKSNVFCVFPFVIHSVILPTPNSVRKYCGRLDFMKERSSNNRSWTSKIIGPIEPIQMVKSLGGSPQKMADVQFWDLVRPKTCLETRSENGPSLHGISWLHQFQPCMTTEEKLILAPQLADEQGTKDAMVSQEPSITTAIFKGLKVPPLWALEWLPSPLVLDWND